MLTLNITHKEQTSRITFEILSVPTDDQDSHRQHTLLGFSTQNIYFSKITMSTSILEKKVLLRTQNNGLIDTIQEYIGINEFDDQFFKFALSDRTSLINFMESSVTLETN